MEGMNQLKVFTLEEANRLLPRLNLMLKDVQEKRNKIQVLEVEIDATELIAEKDEDGVAPGLNKKVEEYTRTVKRFYALIDEIHELGCFVKDIDTGLVDFYSLNKGKVVYLCWKIGEAEVSHWHEIGRGFSSRQAVTPEDFGPNPKEKKN